MKVTEHIADIRQARWANPGETWGLVPTMGFLHQGHLSLVERARQENERVGVSIFVNPTQFNNPADLASYPRNQERDLAMLAAAGVDWVWTPAPDTVYPADYQTYVTVEQVTQMLEGAYLPRHFRGSDHGGGQTVQRLSTPSGLFWAKGRTTGGGHPPDGARFEF